MYSQAELTNGGKPIVADANAAYVGGLLVALYAVLYVLLSLEAYSLLIGALLLFVGLGVVMYATRRLDWAGAGAGRPDDAGTLPDAPAGDSLSV